MDIHTINVDSYNVKYSLNKNDIIRVTLPGVGYDMNKDDCEINDELSDKLLALRWSKKAIDELENMLFRKPWNLYTYLDIQTGKVINTK